MRYDFKRSSVDISSFLNNFQLRNLNKPLITTIH